MERTHHIAHISDRWRVSVTITLPVRPWVLSTTHWLSKVNMCVKLFQNGSKAMERTQNMKPISDHRRQHVPLTLHVPGYFARYINLILWTLMQHQLKNGLAVSRIWNRHDNAMNQWIDQHLQNNIHHFLRKGHNKTNSSYNVANLLL